LQALFAQLKGLLDQIDEREPSARQTPRHAGAVSTDS
jgi:hypothetical protein